MNLNAGTHRDLHDTLWCLVIHLICSIAVLPKWDNNMEVLSSPQTLGHWNWGENSNQIVVEITLFLFAFQVTAADITSGGMVELPKVFQSVCVERVLLMVQAFGFFGRCLFEGMLECFWRAAVSAGGWAAGSANLHLNLPMVTRLVNVTRLLPLVLATRAGAHSCS